MTNRICAFTLLLLSILFTSSCKMEPSDSILHLSNEYDEIDFSMDQLFTDYRIIPLESSHPIEHIHDIRWLDSLIYIATFSGDIFCFQEDGSQFGSVINKRGRGPDEYLGIENMVVSDTSIIINDASARSRIVVYDRNFQFKYSLEHPNILSHPHMEILDTNIILLDRDFKIPKNSWISLLNNGDPKIIKKNTTQLPDFRSRSETKLFSSMHQDDVIYFRPYDDTIYRINNDLENIPYIAINKNFQDGMNYPTLNQLSNIVFEINIRRVSKMMSLGRYILIMNKKDMSDKSIAETILFDTKTGRSFLISEEKYSMDKSMPVGIPFDWYGDGFLWPHRVVYKGTDLYLCCVLDAYRLSQLKDHRSTLKPSNPDFHAHFQRTIDNIRIDDNPVLLLLKVNNSLDNSLSVKKEIE